MSRIQFLFLLILRWKSAKNYPSRKLKHLTPARLEGVEVGKLKKQSFYVLKQKLKIVVDAIFFVQFLELCFAYISTNISLILIRLKSEAEKLQTNSEFMGWLEGTPHTN